MYHNSYGDRCINILLSLLCVCLCVYVCVYMYVGPYITHRAWYVSSEAFQTRLVSSLVKVLPLMHWSIHYNLYVFLSDDSLFIWLPCDVIVGIC